MPRGEGIGRYEAPRGEDVHYVRSNGTNTSFNITNVSTLTWTWKTQPGRQFRTQTTWPT